VDKTTVYLPADLKREVKRAAARRGVSEAEVIRESIRAAMAPTNVRPRGALFESDAAIAERSEESLAGFGDR
jgi:hypothetical protein